MSPGSSVQSGIQNLPITKGGAEAAKFLSKLSGLLPPTKFAGAVSNSITSTGFLLALQIFYGFSITMRRKKVTMRRKK